MAQYFSLYSWLLSTIVRGGKGGEGRGGKQNAMTNGFDDKEEEEDEWRGGKEEDPARLAAVNKD